MTVTARLMIDATEAYNRFCTYIDATHAAHVSGPYGSEHAANIAESAKAAAKKHFANFCTEFDNANAPTRRGIEEGERAHARFCTAIDAERFNYIKNRVIGFAMDRRGYDRDYAEKVFENVSMNRTFGGNLIAHVAGCNAARAAGEEAWNAACFTKFGGVAYDVAYITELCERSLIVAANQLAQAEAWDANQLANQLAKAAKSEANAKADRAEWLANEGALLARYKDQDIHAHRYYLYVLVPVKTPVADYLPGEMICTVHNKLLSFPTMEDAIAFRRKLFLDEQLEIRRGVTAMTV